MGITIYDIAKKAGVSIATVSRVLNQKSNVSEKTKLYIQQILDEYGYKGNQLARGLASKTTKTIGIMAVDIRDSHHSAIVYEAERTMLSYGYSSIVCNLGGIKENLGKYLDTLITRQVDGIVFIGSIFADSSCFEQIEDRSIDFPCVIVNAILPYPNFACILDNEEAAFADAVDFLVKERGRKNIAFISDDNTSSEGRKAKGYYLGIQRNGLKSLKLDTPPGEENIAAAVKELLCSHPETDAILFSKDLTAIYGMYALQDLGCNVPGDIAVIGSNNSIYAKLCRPRLTSIDNMAATNGTTAANILYKLLNEDAVLEPQIIPCSLVIREST